MREDFSRSQTKLRNDFNLENDSVRQEFYAESKVLQHRLEKHCSLEIQKAMQQQNEGSQQAAKPLAKPELDKLWKQQQTYLEMLKIEQDQTFDNLQRGVDRMLMDFDADLRTKTKDFQDKVETKVDIQYHNLRTLIYEFKKEQ